LRVNRMIVTVVLHSTQWVLVKCVWCVYVRLSASRAIKVKINVEDRITDRVTVMISVRASGWWESRLKGGDFQWALGRWTRGSKHFLLKE